MDDELVRNIMGQVGRLQVRRCVRGGLACRAPAFARGPRARSSLPSSSSPPATLHCAPPLQCKLDKEGRLLRTEVGHALALLEQHQR